MTQPKPPSGPRVELLTTNEISSTPVVPEFDERVRELEAANAKLRQQLTEEREQGAKVWEANEEKKRRIAELEAQVQELMLAPISTGETLKILKEQGIDVDLVKLNEKLRTELEAEADDAWASLKKAADEITRLRAALVNVRQCLPEELARPHAYINEALSGGRAGR